MFRFFQKNSIYIFLSTLILLTFSLRFVNLTRLPIFADEAIYIRWSQIMKSEETLRFLPLQDGKQPLFMWTMIAPLKILPDPLIAGRIVSVFSGLGTLVGVAVLSYLLFKSPPSLEASEGRGKKMAIVASAIYALSPYAFFFDRLSTADSMLAMFGVWTFIFSYLAVTKTRLDYAMLAGFALGGAWLTKSPALFFALLLPTLWLFTDSIKKLKKIIPLTLVTVIIGYGMYNILRLGPNFHQLAARNADYVYPLTHIFQDWLNPFKTFLLMSFEWIWMMGPFSIIVLWLLSYFINWKKDRKILLVLTVWFLGPIFVQAEFAKVFTARYIFFTIPYLFILAAGAFNSGHYKKIRVLGLIFILFSLHSIIYNNYLLTDPQKADMHRSERSGYLEEWTAGQGTREVADFIRKEAENIPANKKVVVGTEGYFGTLPDGLQIYFDKNPKVLIIGVGLSLDKIPQSLIDTKNDGNRTFILANNERLHVDFETLGAKVVKKYPKAIRPDGTYQELWLIEL